MKTTIFVLLSVALLVPRPSSAASIRDVDNSDYGMQLPGPCPSISNSSGFTASCSFTDFSSPSNGFVWGFMVWFESPVSNVAVTFSHANIFDTGLDVCNSDSADPADDCLARPSTPTLDLAQYPNALSQFSMPSAPVFGVPNSSVEFDLNGAIQASPAHGHEVAYLLLCTPNPNNPSGGPESTDCGGVSIAVSPLASTTGVPEPGSLFLCGSAAAMLARRLKNRRRRQ